MELHTNYTEKRGLLGHKHVLEWTITFTPEETKVARELGLMQYPIFMESKYVPENVSPAIHLGKALGKKQTYAHFKLDILHIIEADLKEELRGIKGDIERQSAGPRGPETTTF